MDQLIELEGNLGMLDEEEEKQVSIEFEPHNPDIFVGQNMLF